MFQTQQKAIAASGAAKHRNTAGAGLLRDCIKYKGLLLLLLPSALWFILFKYVPMYGVVIAFKNYRYLDGIFGSPWVGVRYFEKFLHSAQFISVLWNTLIISFYKILFAFPAPILLAVLLNEIGKVRFKKVVQTITYLPHFISWVVIASLIKEILSPTTGVVNYFITALGMEPVNFLVRPDLFRGIVVLSVIWKEIGWGSIIYLAAITGIDEEMYEAAKIDGASRLKQTLYITLPSIVPAVVIMFLLRIGNIMNAGFEEILNLYNPVVYNVGDIIDTYVYRVGLIDANYSYSTAINLFKNVLGLLLLVFTNQVTKKISDYGIW